MNMDEFEKIVINTVDKMPVKFRKILNAHDIRILARENVPKALRNRNKNCLIFGVFVGVPHNKRSVFNIEQEPTRIELYKKSFDKAFNSRLEIKEQIAKTVVHEIGHYFGFSEKEVRQRGL